MDLKELEKQCLNFVITKLTEFGIKCYLDDANNQCFVGSKFVTKNGQSVLAQEKGASCTLNKGEEVSLDCLLPSLYGLVTDISDGVNNKDEEIKIHCLKIQEKNSEFILNVVYWQYLPKSN
tara:strand:+ start:4698 stop:5060 length:363 start_codon:yes stop_codon:yes gene_type:complete